MWTYKILCGHRFLRHLYVQQYFQNEFRCVRCPVVPNPNAHSEIKWIFEKPLESNTKFLIKCLTEYLYPCLREKHVCSTFMLASQLECVSSRMQIIDFAQILFWDLCVWSQVLITRLMQKILLCYCNSQAVIFSPAFGNTCKRWAWMLVDDTLMLKSE